MLDGLISMMELIVAMEELGDIDVEGNGIDFSDLFALDDNNRRDYDHFAETYETMRQNIINMITEGSEEYNQDLARIANSTQIGRFTLARIFGMDEATLRESLSEGEQAAYAAMLEALYRAAISGDYDLDHIYESMREIL